jgi:RNA polymerase sigma-70 factor (ECF subfamily)
MPDSSADPAGARPAGFASTQWGLVARAGDPAAPQAREALAALCAAYWYPIYAYLRRRTGDAESALDLTQGFFADLLARNALSAADPARGKFRTFLLRCCDNYLANQRDAGRARKRGGGRQPLSLDFAAADERYRREPADPATPEALSRRRWALTLLEATCALLEQDYERAGHGELYRLLRPTLTAEANAPAYATVAAALGLSEPAVRKAAQRLRQRYGELLRHQIATTVAGPEQVEEEIRELFAAVAP